MAVGQPVRALAPPIAFDYPVIASADPLRLGEDEQDYSTGGETKFDGYTFAVENGRLVGRVGSAYHRFLRMDVVSFTQTSRVLIIVLRSGQVVGIDKNLMDGVIFRGPPPVFHLTNAGVGAEAGAVIETVFVDHDAIRSLYDDKEAPLNEPRDRAWEAGYVSVIKRSGNVRTEIDQIHFSTMADEFAAQEEILQRFTDLLHPDGRRRVPGQGSAKNDWPRAPRARRDMKIDWPSAQKLMRLQGDTVESLTGSIKDWTSEKPRARDQFRIDGENVDDIGASLARSKKKLTPRKLAAIGAATLGGGAVIAAGAYYGFTPEVAHSVHVTFNHWLGLISPVLVDAKYRKLMGQSMMWVSLIPPVIWATATIVDRLITKRGNTALAIADGGMRAIGELNEPFWRRMADLLRQPHIVRAFSLGLNPREIVRPDSRLGRLAQLDKPTRQGWVDSSGGGRARVKRLVDVIERQKVARTTFAKWLALSIVADENRLDPETIALLAASDNPAAGRALEFSDRMVERQRVLTDLLIKDLESRPAEFDVTKLDLTQIEGERKHAQALIGRLAGLSDEEKTSFKKRARRDETLREVRRGAHTFARSINTFWRTAHATLDLAQQNGVQFFFDFYMGMFITYLFGSRANLNDPPSLVAQPGALFATGRPPLWAFLDTGRWYLLNYPAMLTAIYQQKQVKREKRFDAREAKLEKPNYRGPGFARSLRWYARDMANMSEGRYGEILLDKFILSQRMTQTTFFLTVVSRVLLSGAGFWSSVFSYTAYHFAGHLLIGWFFDVLQPTNNRMDARIARYRELTESATGKLRRGLRMNQSTTWIEGMTEALNLFDHPDAPKTPENEAYVQSLRSALTETPTMDQARDTLIKVMMEPPLPGRTPNWIKHTATALAVFLSTEAGIYVDVIFFRPGVNWGLIVGGSILVAGIAYSSLWAGLKKWRSTQAKTRHACEESLLSPGLSDVVRSLRTKDLQPAF